MVSGRGIGRLRDAGIEVECDMLQARGLELNKRFFTAMTSKRPYVILKWAETADGFLGPHAGTPVHISGSLSNMRVHKWRTEEDSIMVGYKTALMDNPRLNVRHWAGTNPVRIVTDRRLQLPKHLHLLDNSQSTIVVNYDHGTEIPTDPERYALPSTAYLKIDRERDEIAQLLEGLHGRKIHSVLVEGGGAVINAFLESGLWDEIRRCQGKLTIGEGVNAPMPRGIFRGSEQIGNDLWTFYSRI